FLPKSPVLVSRFMTLETSAYVPSNSPVKCTFVTKCAEQNSSYRAAIFSPDARLCIVVAGRGLGCRKMTEFVVSRKIGVGSFQRARRNLTPRRGTLLRREFP